LPSQADVVTIDWAAHARMVEAEKAATAAGLPPPPSDPPPFTGTRDRPFRFYLTRWGQPLLAQPLLAHPLLAHPLLAHPLLE
ncbi:MAG TPA: hypothetical protein VHS58_17540, partial [Acetobacteraceae bacterium]|nr:hypothetical protein [Acetobacteraceae bacterium]